MDNDKKRRAKAMMKVIKAACDQVMIKYKEFPAAYAVEFVMPITDIPCTVRLATEACVLGVIAEFPFTVPETVRGETAIGLCILNDALADGSFDFDYNNGRVLFRVTSSYRDSLVSEAVVSQMMRVVYENVFNKADALKTCAFLGDVDGFRRLVSEGGR